MHIILRLLIGLILVIALAAGALAALPYWPSLKDRFGAEPFQDWLTAQRTVIDVAEPIDTLSFDDAVYDSRLVLLSEIHGYRAVQAIDLILLRHFAQTGPARTYLAELGPDQAMAFNIYLATGEDAAVRSVFDDWAAGDYQWANAEFFDKLTAIRSLNAELPEERQIWFVGVDQLGSAERLEALARFVQDDAEAGFDRFEQVQAINASLGALALQRAENAGRYTHMLENIAWVTQLGPQRHFYGLWGLFHGTKTTVNGAEPLALRLNRDGGSFEGSVTTFTTLCIEGCLNLMPARAMPGFLHGGAEPNYIYLPMSFDDALLQRVRGANDLRSAMGEADIAAFRVTGEDSPYNSSDRLSALTGYLSMVQTFEYGGPASEISDYFIVMRGSAGLTPWDGQVHDTSGRAARTGIPAVEQALRPASTRGALDPD